MIFADGIDEHQAAMCTSDVTIAFLHEEKCMGVATAKVTRSSYVFIMLHKIVLVVNQWGR